MKEGDKSEEEEPSLGLYDESAEDDVNFSLRAFFNHKNELQMDLKNTSKPPKNTPKQAKLKGFPHLIPGSDLPSFPLGFIVELHHIYQAGVLRKCYRPTRP